MTLVWCFKKKNLKVHLHTVLIPKKSSELVPVSLKDARPTDVH